MRIKVLSRSETANTRSRRDDSLLVQRNLDPVFKPMQAHREYVRALKAAKLSRLFAKPFVGALEGHTDGVACMATSSRNLAALLSGSCNGELMLWDLAEKRCVGAAAQAHRGFVRGVAVCADGREALSVGDDKTARLWTLQGDSAGLHARAEFQAARPLLGCDCSWQDDAVFATCGDDVSLWDSSRAQPVHAFSWGSDAVLAVKFNPAEPWLLASVGGSDRSVALYDSRQTVALRKLVMAMRSNQVAWNPMEPMCFTVANEDGNLYSFDMRNLDAARNVHTDHVAAVMDVSFSPSGREFVSASYDRSVRIFSTRGDAGRSREVYTAPRMQRVFACKFTMDARFVASGSEDTIVRLWKAEAARPLGVVSARQERALRYGDKLVERFSAVGEVRSIAKGRRLPRLIFKERQARNEQAAAARRKQERVAAHSRPGSARQPPLRERHLVQTME